MGNICPKIKRRKEEEEEEDNSSPKADRSFDNYDKSNTNMCRIINKKNNSSSKERGSNNILNEKKKKMKNYEEPIKFHEKERIDLVEQQNQSKNERPIFSQKKLQLDDKEKELNNKEQKIIKEENSLNEQKK